MSIIDEGNGFEGDIKRDGFEPNLQWSPFKQYHQLNRTATRIDINLAKSVIDNTFPDKELDDEIECKHQEALVSVPCLAKLVCNNEPLSLGKNLTTSEYTCGNLANRESVCLWEILQSSYFRKKTIQAAEMTWRRNFLYLFTLGTEGGSRFGKGSTWDVIKDLNDKHPNCYCGLGKPQNGFYVSSNGLVFSSEIELKRFIAKMAEIEERLKHEMCVIEDQRNKLKTKAEERKLLSHRMESVDSDQDETPKENQQLNKENKAKDKTERKSGLFASLSASLSAARSGIQGFLERSSPKEQRHATNAVLTGDSDGEDETDKLTQKPNPDVDGLDNHDEFTRQMEVKGGLTYESADRTVHQLSHDALPPPLSLQSLQAENQADK
ncbi:uncharacterized protein LOC111333903 isoform X1 [Stylophora pistillata]|uniref:Uncharacterized protein n=1 Tax=Stylophora pistillata TaxID=50429 RepID=A0A2B4RYH4_STYPI|nr:uncharacterized protein LOC111333903 isoform X1 [Stylophora pistillata]PFX22681.1 hypothetical protein AWC38_SpisGene12798 [Stylophora pistillata]